jgi:hypothetical protein
VTLTLTSRGLLFALLFAAAGCGVQEVERGLAKVTTEPTDAHYTPPRAVHDAAAAPLPDANLDPEPAVDAGVSAKDAAAAMGALDGPARTPDMKPVPVDPGAGVTIAGTFIPRDKVVVFIHIGHSNMAGRATKPEAEKPYFYDPDPQLWVYGKGAFKPAQEPTAPDNEDGQAAGPGMALLRSGLAIAPEDTVFVSIGHGHSGSFGGYCTNFRKGGLFYDVAMKPAMELHGKVTYGGIFTMFGQSEHQLDAAANQKFADCLAGMAAEMRADLGEPELPFVMGDYEAGISRADIAPNSALGKILRAQLQMAQMKIARSQLIPTDGLEMQDDHHFDMAGHKLWATRAMQILVDNKWAPWAKP